MRIFQARTHGHLGHPTYLPFSIGRVGAIAYFILFERTISGHFVFVQHRQTDILGQALRLAMLGDHDDSSIDSRVIKLSIEDICNPRRFAIFQDESSSFELFLRLNFLHS